jgi:oxygen-independent coproporphyrinogen-3 oxidase
MKIEFDAELIQRYDKSGPRYTSYPTAVSFSDDFRHEKYCQHARLSNQAGGPLSLYFHIPFCDTICFYCACNKIATKDYSKTPIYLEYLFREMDMQAAMFDSSRIVEQLHWGGGTPTFLKHHEIEALMEYTRKSFNLLEDDSGDYSIEIDPRSVSTDTIKLLRKTGFNRFSLGVQDVDEKVQKAVNRIQPVKDTQAIIDACRKYKAHSVSIDLIYGLPFQTVSGFAETVNAAIRMNPDRMSVFNYAHLPHIFKPQRRINVDDLPSAQEKLDIFQQSIEILTDAGYEYIGMDHFAKPDDELAIAQAQGSLHRNFQGYTTHSECDLIAMGVSSISSVENSYSQNEKVLESYYAAIDNGRIPVVRGIALSEDDVIRRSVIQQLSCQFKLDFASVEQRFNLSFGDYFASELEELASMQRDGLLAVDSKRILISAKGRMLVRNVCMVFDAHLKLQITSQKFSRVI